MKKVILNAATVFFFIMNYPSFCQQVGNSSFEDWVIEGLNQYPVGWTSSNDFSLPIGFQGVSVDSTAFEGNFAAKIITTNIGFAGAPYAGFIVNGKMNVSGHYDIDSIHKAGEPFTSTPDALSGYYRYDSDAAIEDWAQVFVLLKRYDSLNQKIDTIAFGENTMLNPSQEFRYFTVELDYRMADVKPDSIVIAFFSTYPVHPISGGRLVVDNIKLEYATDIKEVHPPHPFLIYPNPAREFIRIPESISGHVRIFSVSGKLLLEFKNKQNLDISSLSPGIYFLSSQQEGSWARQKFIKN